MSMINPVTLAVVKSALDASALRQVAHANNIANASTPGYRAFHVVFEERLDAVRDAIREQRADEIDVANLPAAQMEQSATPETISLDTEVAAMSQNALQYQVLAKALSHHYSLLGMAMSEGRR
jgi:flagellar basal-body rod protein FlgB